MPTNPVITVFEHQTLRVGDVQDGVVFDQARWEALVSLHPTLPQPYYSLTHRGIRLSHYVGVLQTPALTLEILPKADAHAVTGSRVWRRVLVDLLAECRYLKLHRQHAEQTSLRAGVLLDFFLLDFLAEVETLCRRGLIRQYQLTQGNERAMRGRLLIAQQLRRNAVHQERFFVQHQTHSVQHPLHRLLKQALRMVTRVSFHPLVRQQSRQLLTYFAAVPDTAEPLLPPRRYNRQTIAYCAVATMAHQIVKAHFPHVYQGQRRQGLAMMLDMNLIFEEFVYQRLRRLAVTRDFVVHRQRSRPLWGTSKVRPDIVVELPDGRGNVVIDTKWKILKHPRPAAEDLHQIYVYNQLFAARKGVLLYPQVYNLPAQKRRFDGPESGYAEVSFLQIADEQQGGLHPKLDEQLLQLVDP